MEKITIEDIANLNTVWELPKNKKPIVIIGAGGIVSDAHLPAYKKALSEGGIHILVEYPELYYEQ